MIELKGKPLNILAKVQVDTQTSENRAELFFVRQGEEFFLVHLKMGRGQS